MNYRYCFCLNKNYVTVLIVIMATLELEKRVFLIKNYYQRGESVEYARKAFNRKYGVQTAPHRDTVKR